MTYQTTLVTIECPTCGQESRQVKARFYQEIKQSEELTIKGNVSILTSSELFYHVVLNCQNCVESSVVQSVNLN